MSENNDTAESFPFNNGVSGSSRIIKVTMQMQSEAFTFDDFYSLIYSRKNRFSAWVDLDKIIPGKPMTAGGRGPFIHQNTMTHRRKR